MTHCDSIDDYTDSFGDDLHAYHESNAESTEWRSAEMFSRGLSITGSSGIFVTDLTC